MEASDAADKSKRVRKCQSQGSKGGGGWLTSPTATASKNNIYFAPSGELCAGSVVDPSKYEASAAKGGEDCRGGGSEGSRTSFKSRKTSSHSAGAKPTMVAATLANLARAQMAASSSRTRAQDSRQGGSTTTTRMEITEAATAAATQRASENDP